jgi:hypothetical protein
LDKLINKVNANCDDKEDFVVVALFKLAFTYQDYGFVINVVNEQKILKILGCERIRFHYALEHLDIAWDTWAI